MDALLTGIVVGREGGRGGGGEGGRGGGGEGVGGVFQPWLGSELLQKLKRGNLFVSK